MSDDDSTGSQERAAQHLRQARDDLSEMDDDEQTLVHLLIMFVLHLAETYLTEKYEETKGRSPE